MTEPASELPEGEALVGYVVIATEVVHVSECNGQQCTVIQYAPSASDEYCGPYLCRFNDGTEWFVKRENMRPV